MRLIDILNKIANGELKEGAKVIREEETYIWNNKDCFFYDEKDNFICLDPMKCLNDEVELTEPNDFGEADKMIEPTDNTKIEELKYDETDFECLGIHSATIFLSIQDKLNEVIRILNKRG